MSSESIRKIKERDPGEWDRVLKVLLHDLLVYFSVRATARVDSCDDLVQETLMHVMKAIDDFTPVNEEHFRRWVFRIAKNCLVDSARRASRYVRFEIQYSRERATLVVPEPEIRGHSDWRDLRDDVREELAALPPKQRQAVFLKYCVGMTTEEVARKMNIAPGTVSQHLHKGSVVLRTSLRARMSRASQRRHG